jgi:hypothetical protein
MKEREGGRKASRDMGEDEILVISAEMKPPIKVFHRV